MASEKSDWEPVPIGLEPIFRLSCPVEKAHVVGDSGEGMRKIVPITQGGRIESNQVPAFDGAIGMPGGSDYFRTDRFGKTRLDARYFFKLKSGRKSPSLLLSHLASFSPLSL